MLTIVSGSSMEETLHDHQIVAVDRLRYALADPQRGDIVICHYPNDSKNYVKRIVAIAGDWLQIQDGVTFLNGQALQEEYIVYKAYSDFGPYRCRRAAYSSWAITAPTPTIPAPRAPYPWSCWREGCSRCSTPSTSCAWWTGPPSRKVVKRTWSSNKKPKGRKKACNGKSWNGC